MALIRKVYKLPVANTANGKKGRGKSVVNGAPDEEKERKELEVQVLGIMALKGT